LTTHPFDNLSAFRSKQGSFAEDESEEDVAQDRDDPGEYYYDDEEEYYEDKREHDGFVSSTDKRRQGYGECLTSDQMPCSHDCSSLGQARKDRALFAKERRL